jgi:hypothetical protein
LDKQPDPPLPATVDVERAASDEDHSLLVAGAHRVEVSGSSAQRKKPPLGSVQAISSPRVVRSACFIASRLARSCANVRREPRHDTTSNRLVHAPLVQHAGIDIRRLLGDVEPGHQRRAAPRSRRRGIPAASVFEHVLR